MGRLTASWVRTTTDIGRKGDGRGSHGLALVVRPRADGGVRKAWIQQIRGTDGKVKNYGLGSYPVVSLAEAREKALENARSIAAGRTPGRSVAPTFLEAAERVMEQRMPTWRDGSRSERQWRSSLETYVYPLVGHKRVDTITSEDLLEILEPIWHEVPETARRVRQRIGAVLAWSIGKRYREDNPARSDAVTYALQPNAGSERHPALPPEDVPAALSAVEGSEAWVGTKLLFRFIVLTACRHGAARNARWDEIDLENAIWVIPSDRAKKGHRTKARPHRVPLSNAALMVLRTARDMSDGSDLVFLSTTGRAISDRTLNKLLEMKGFETVVHGFRSSFRDWCAESGVPWEVAEQAMAHTVKGVEGRYKRTDMLERRREVMEAWATYCGFYGDLSTTIPDSSATSRERSSNPEWRTIPSGV